MIVDTDNIIVKPFKPIISIGNVQQYVIRITYYVIIYSGRHLQMRKVRFIYKSINAIVSAEYNNGINVDRYTNLTNIYNFVNK